GVQTCALPISPSPLPPDRVSRNAATERPTRAAAASAIPTTSAALRLQRSADDPGLVDASPGSPRSQTACTPRAPRAETTKQRASSILVLPVTSSSGSRPVTDAKGV